MGKKDDETAAAGGDGFDDVLSEAPPLFTTPIADPILQGKLALRTMRLIRKAAVWEQTAGEGGKPLKASMRQVKRGVAEVTKALRKGQKGLVILACDVAPVDIIAHLPIFCEEQDVRYAFLSSKRVLGVICRTPRPTSVLMVCKPRAEWPHCDLFDKIDAALTPR